MTTKKIYTTLLLALLFALPGFSAIGLIDTNLPSGVQGAAYSFTLSANGGTAPYSFELVSGALPNGVGLSSTGVLSGNPTNSGLFNFTIRITDNTSSTSNIPLVLLVNSNSGLQIVTSSLPQGQLGTGYNASLAATGGSPGYLWDGPISGSLPNGLSITSNGNILGTPTLAGNFSFVIRVRDSNGSGSSALASFTLRINSNVLTIGTTSLPNGSLGAFYSQTLSISGGAQPYSIGLLSGSLPPGIELQGNGVLSGTPTAIGTSNFVVRVIDANVSQFSRSLSITIGAQQFAINQTPLPTGQVGAAYSATVTASGGNAPYTYSILNGSLPTGIAFSNGSFSGTPTVSGNFPLSIQARDNTNATVSVNFSLVINSTSLVLNTTTLPNAVVNQSYFATITASGGQQPYTFSIVGGQLPPGISLSTGGNFSGGTTTAGLYQFTVRVTDAFGAVTQSVFQLTASSSNLSLVSTALPNAQVNQPYTASLSASGGTAPYLFTIVGGALPQGLTLGANGSISGTPTTSGSFQITFRVQDSFQNIAQSTITLQVNSFNFRITTSFLSSGQLGQPYSGNVTADGGTPGYLFILVSGQLPPGISLSTGGVFSGTPTVAGNYSFTVRALDNGNRVAEANFSISINSSSITLTNASLPAAQLNQSYSAALSASGGTAPFTFSVVSGSIPAGISLSTAGVISGTPTVSGTFNFAIQVRDNLGSTAVFNLSLVVGNSAIAITTTSLPNGTVGVFYSSAIVAANGLAPYSFSLTGGSLPSGLNLSSSGVISGTPNVDGNFNFSVRVTDSQSSTATANLSLQVGGTGTLNIVTSTLDSAQVNVFYNAIVSVSGGAAPYSFSIVSGQLPPGLSLLSTGGISGTPTVGGNFIFTLRVADGFGSSTQRSLSISVNSSGLSITTATLPNAQLGQFFSVQFAALGGSFPYSWTIASGTLPTGVSLSPQGILSGLPTTGGGFEFAIRVTDTAGLTAQKTFSLAVGSNFLSFLTTSLPQGFVNQQYSAQLQVGGGAGPYSFSIINGTLPTGLNLTANGQILGVPQATSFNVITFRVTDAAFATSQVTLNLAIGQSSLQFSTATLSNASLGQNYSLTLVASGGTSPYTFSVASGSLPPGIALSPSGILSGVATTAGFYSFTLRVQDAANAIANQNFSLNVLAGSIQITTASLPAGRVNQAYLQTIQTVGGVAPIRLEILSTINSGFPPPGLTLSISGVLSGTPQAVGTYTFTVRATDAQNLSAQATYQLVVAPAAPVITTSSLPPGTVGRNYGQSISASGGTPPYTFSLINGVAPPPLLLSPGGILSGTPNLAGTFTFTVRVSDAAQQTVDATYTVEISAGTTALTISALAPPAALLHLPYNFTLSATGGSLPYTWSVPVGPIPNGLRLDANGVLNGLPLAPGTYRFSVRVVDSLGAVAETNLGITVAPALRLLSGQVNVPYSAQAPSPIVGRPPFNYILNGNALGDLPVGVNLSSSGVLSGTPTAAGEYTFGLLIRDASSLTSNATVTVSIAAAPGLAIETPSLPGGSIGTTYNQTLSARDGRAPYNWAVAVGSLPNGLSLNPATGQVSGNPTQQGTTFFVARVTDAAGSSATAYFGISIAAANTPVLSAITSAASYGANGVAPGELIVLFGGTLGPLSLSQFSLVNNEVPSLLAGSRVLFDGVPAPLIYSVTGQVSAIAPFNISDRPSTRIVAEYQGVQSTPYILPVVSSKPALFTVDSSGQGPGAILNQDGSVNTQSNRAGRESVIVLYATGAGEMTPGGQAGRVAAGISSLNQQTLVSINGSPANVIYSGNAPGLVEGVVQINVRLPFNTVSGQNSIRVQVGPNASTANVSVWVQ